jgi:Zn finger protein HypA/HybF involved in hydrogenase expression
MWTKYDYVCSDCDSLIEITTLEYLEDCPWCPACASMNVINISINDGNAPVIDITPRTVVKIDSNPYN